VYAVEPEPGLIWINARWDRKFGRYLPSVRVQQECAEPRSSNATTAEAMCNAFAAA
jgi:hypothetical protein